MSEPFSIAKQVLEEAWGAKVRVLPTSTKNECDLLADFNGIRLLVEEKTKFDDPHEQQKREAALAAEQIHGSVLPLGHNNRLSGIIRKATKQLSSTASDTDYQFRIVWFTAVDFHAEAKHYQFISTLYGSTKIFELNKPKIRECYFFRNSDFFRYRDRMDGAVVGFLQGEKLTVKLCLNPYSSSWEELRDSPFAANFKFGLIDPVAEEAVGESFIADTNLPRNNEHTIIRFLEEKYGLEMAHNMDMNMASVVVRVPNGG